MTMPSGSNPSFFDTGDFGINGGTAGSISGLANRSRSNVEGFYKDKIQNDSSWKLASEQIFQGLEDAFLGLPTALAKAIAQALAGIHIAGAEDLNDVLAAAAAFFDGKWENLTANTVAIADLSTIASPQATTAAYVGDQQDMVSVPRSQLITTAGWGAKSQDILTAIPIGAFLGNALPVFFPKIYFGSTVGRIYYTPITVDRSGHLGKIRWIVGADTSITSINYYEVALCVYNPANGNVEKVWGSGNIKDTTASTTSLAEVEIDMGLSAQTVTPGQVLFVAHQQTAPGLFQSPRAFAAVPQGGINRTSSSLLQAASYRTGAWSQGIPSSLSFAGDLNKESGFIPWAGVTVVS